MPSRMVRISHLRPSIVACAQRPDLSGWGRGRDLRRLGRSESRDGHDCRRVHRRDKLLHSRRLLGGLYMMQIAPRIVVDEDVPSGQAPHRRHARAR